MRRWLFGSCRWVGRGLLWLEEKPLAVVLAAAGATVGVAVALGSAAGWPRLMRLAHAPHSWAWLAVCMVGELVAYGGYVLTIRDMARVDQGPELDLSVSTTTVVAGFGVFAATRSTGGFAVDYWAFRKAGAGRRDALSRVLGLGFLEYAALGTATLVASTALFFRLDGHASLAATLPSLIIVPGFLVAFWVTSPDRAPRLGRIHQDDGKFRTAIANTVNGATRVRTLLTSPREHGLGVVGISLYWAGDILCLWAALQLVGGKQITIATLVLGYASGYVLTRRSLPAGGAGLVEAALTFALVGMGVRFLPALLGVIVYRLFNFWLPIIPALILLPAVRDLRTRFHHAEQASAST